MKKQFQELNLRLTVEEHKEIKLLALQKDMSMKALILLALKKYKEGKK